MRYSLYKSRGLKSRCDIAPSLCMLYPTSPGVSPFRRLPVIVAVPVDECLVDLVKKMAMYVGVFGATMLL